MKTRKASITRKTLETEIELTIDLSKPGSSSIQTGIGFLDHMLTLFAFHSQISLEIKAKGDLEIDPHHTTEDIGICLGEALRKALGEKTGINRYGTALMPMDEALCQIAIDISNRPYLDFKCELPNNQIGNFDTELVQEFWLGFVNNARITAHITQLSGKNTHHIIEAIFKGFGRALSQAIKIEGDAIPSSKGML